MSKFNIGDTVECCISSNKAQAGNGYSLGLVFKVSRVYKVGGDNKNCYFGGVDGNGVYEPYLELYVPVETIKVDFTALRNRL